MLIQVLYPDNRFDYVKDNMLHGLIESRAIARFKRSSGWVTVGVDPLRQFNRSTGQVKPDVGVKKIIRVEYSDNRFDYVTNEMLDSLIESNKIVKFMRSTGWVTLGVDPLRKVKREHSYSYPNELRGRA